MNARPTPRDIAAWRRGRRAGIASYSDAELTETLDRAGGLARLSVTCVADYRATLHEARVVRGFAVVVTGDRHVLIRPAGRTLIEGSRPRDGIEGAT